MKEILVYRYWVGNSAFQCHTAVATGSTMAVGVIENSTGNWNFPLLLVLEFTPLLSHGFSEILFSEYFGLQWKSGAGK